MQTGRPSTPTLLDIPVDEDSLVRHYTLAPADLLEIQMRRREHNQLGFAIQLCLMRYPGRPLLANEIPPKAMLDYVEPEQTALRRLHPAANWLAGYPTGL